MVLIKIKIKKKFSLEIKVYIHKFYKIEQACFSNIVVVHKDKGYNQQFACYN